jgi:hypothetical protein
MSPAKNGSGEAFLHQQKQVLVNVNMQDHLAQSPADIFNIIRSESYKEFH